MKQSLPIFLLAFLSVIAGNGQTTRYIIQLKDKANNPFSLSNPSQYLSQRAIDRRLRYQIAIDSTDLPVSPAYLDSILSAGNITILNTSRWLNQVAILTDDNTALANIGAMPFVKSVDQIANRTMGFIDKFPQAPDFPLIGGLPKTNDLLSYGRANAQVNIHRGHFLHDHFFRGEQMQLAILDAGFYRFKTLPTFDSARTDNRILGTWDFVARDSNVNEDNSHGMQCFSTIAANLPGTFVGSAPEASFYLFRTEDVSSEYPIEEQNWAAGAEKADSLGVDVISSSLGYNTFSDPAYNYTYADMNGRTTISAKAANLASRKGMLVFVSAGNEGNNSWHYICTPADADSIITVGATDSLGNIAGFSSYGPSSDGRLKPSMASVGANAIVASANSGLPIYSSGTSFACPNLAGIGTCLWQAFPELSNMQIKRILEQASHKFNTPDNRYGYGIPDAKKAFILGQRKLFSFSPITTGTCSATISFHVKADSSMKISVERKLPSQNNYSAVFAQTGPANFSSGQYSFTDDLRRQLPGAIRYRVKVEINSDTSYYLDSTVLNFQQECLVTSNSYLLIQPFAGAENTSIKMATTAAGKAALTLHDALGRKVLETEFDQPEGIQIKPIPVKQLSAGMYFVSVFFEGKRVLSEKIIKP